MAKGAYGGVNDLSRKITKIYGGVGGTSKKIVKGYAGVNGVARQFWPAVNPPAEVYQFYLSGAWDHVPSGFNFNSNQQNVVYSSGYADIKQYLTTDKTIWWHDPDYTRGWSEDGSVINSNFVYDSDVPNMRNHIIFPTWDGTYTDANRAKIPSGANNYYLKITALGCFYMRLLMLNDSAYGFTTIDLGLTDYVLVHTDTPQTVLAKIDTEFDVRYIDRIEIYTAGNTSTDDDAWLTSQNARQHNDSTGIWSQVVTRFYYGYNDFEVYWSNGSPHRDVVKRVSSNAQVYSLTWRSWQSSPVNKNGGELLSRAAFSVEHIVYDYQGNIISDNTVPAEQVIYNGLAFYRYRVQRDYGWYNFSGWSPRPFIDERSAFLLQEDGRLEYEFYQSVEEIYDTAQISEISIITQ